MKKILHNEVLDKTYNKLDKKYTKKDIRIIIRAYLDSLTDIACDKNDVEIPTIGVIRHRKSKSRKIFSINEEKNVILPDRLVPKIDIAPTLKNKIKNHY